MLPEQAKVTFRGVPSLQSKIAPNIINPPVRPSFFHNLVGYYPCKKCVGYLHNTRGRSKSLEFKSMTTNSVYPIRVFYTCATRHIVYMIMCPCGKQYVGHTIRTFTIRVGEHIAKIKNGDTKHTVPRHYREHHNCDPKFLVIDKYIPPLERGCNDKGCLTS